MQRFLRLLYQPYKWIFYIPFFGLCTAVMGSTAIVLKPILGTKVSSAIAGVWWARVSAFLAPILVTVKGRRNINEQQSYVVVANHQSQSDIFVLYGWLGVDFKWVMKMELRKAPFLGSACHALGHIFIDRSNQQAAIESLKEAKKKIVNGTSVLFFPEGTRSKDGELIEFKKGAFVMALDLGIPLLPVTINNTRNILPPDTLDLFPGRAEMIIHEPIDVSAFDRENLDQLIADVKACIQKDLRPAG